MITVRKAADRGRTRTDWLDSAHTFSFGGYRDPAHTGFRDLLVLNDDRVAPGRGFGPHPHREMEILTVVLEGALAHSDSTGNAGVIRAGDVQRMSAGTGIVHSEMNASPHAPVHFLQIWLPPATPGLAPGYEQRTLPDAAEGWVTVADPEGRGGALTVHQDVSLLRGRLGPGRSETRALAKDRHAWIQVVAGSFSVEGRVLEAGDGGALSGVERFLLEAHEPSELLLFDLR